MIVRNGQEISHPCIRLLILMDQWILLSQTSYWSSSCGCQRLKLGLPACNHIFYHWTTPFSIPQTFHLLMQSRPVPWFGWGMNHWIACCCSYHVSQGNFSQQLNKRKETSAFLSLSKTSLDNSGTVVNSGWGYKQRSSHSPSSNKGEWGWCSHPPPPNPARLPYFLNMPISSSLLNEWRIM